MSHIIKISVVMSVFNGEKYLRDAIESVLNQSFKDFEFIIVNDGSTDDSERIIMEFSDRRIVYIQQENAGLSAALNKGCAVARGEYIARMDADDICESNRLNTQYNFMLENRRCVVVGPNAHYIDMQGRFLYTSNLPLTPMEIKLRLPRSPFFHSATLFKKDVFDLVGGYNTEITHYIEDKILWNMMGKYGDLCNIAEPLLNYRIVPTSITAEKKDLAVNVNEIFNKIMSGQSLSQEEKGSLLNGKSKASTAIKMSYYYNRIGKISIEKNFNRSLALRNLLLSISYYWFNKNALFNLALLMFPRFIIEFWKGKRIVDDGF